MSKPLRAALQSRKGGLLRPVPRAARRIEARELAIFAATMLRAIERQAPDYPRDGIVPAEKTLPEAKPVAAARNFPCGEQNERLMPLSAQAAIDWEEALMSQPKATMLSKLCSGTRNFVSRS